MCEHLILLEKELHAAGIRETYRGQPWGDNCREWIYFDCVLDTETIRRRLQLPAFVEDHINNDMRSGLEAGFFCSRCKDAVMGLHPSSAKDKLTYQ